MANYTDDAVRAKLSSLNETQESIVSVAQWLLFYRRYASRTAELWKAKTEESNSSKRLNLLYLANEVVQQSKARKKEDFVNAFTPIIAEGTAIAYKSAPLDIQGKIRRVIEVWRARSIFDHGTQDDVEKRLADIDMSRGSRKPGLGLGGALLSVAEAPPLFQAALTAQTEVAKAEAKAKSAIEAYSIADTSASESIADTAPSRARVNALTGILSSLNEATSSISTAIAKRKQLLEGLEKLLVENKAALSADEETMADLENKAKPLQAQKQEIEQQIIQGIIDGGEGDYDPPPPEAEPLTPPTANTTTPPGSPKPVDLGASVLGHSILGTAQGRPLPESNGASEQPAKRRKLDHADDEFAAFAGKDVMAGLDPDVAAMLN